MNQIILQNENDISDEFGFIAPFEAKKSSLYYFRVTLSPKNVFPAMKALRSPVTQKKTNHPKTNWYRWCVVFAVVIFLFCAHFGFPLVCVLCCVRFCVLPCVAASLHTHHCTQAPLEQRKHPHCFHAWQQLSIPTTARKPL